MLDLAAKRELCALYLAKEVTHFVQMLRKRLVKQLSRPLGETSLHVVVAEERAHLSPEQWEAVLETTNMDPTASSLFQSPSQELLNKCSAAVDSGAMEKFHLRRYGECGGFDVFVECRTP